jgi:hypothetical protein
MTASEFRRHESVDHVDPTDAGLMDPTRQDAPGTGIMGDETVVRDLDDGQPPGIYPDPPAHTGGAAQVPRQPRSKMPSSNQEICSRPQRHIGCHSER